MEKRYQVPRRSPPGRWRRREAGARQPPPLMGPEPCRPEPPSGPGRTRWLWLTQRCRAAALRWKSLKNLPHCATAKEDEVLES